MPLCRRGGRLTFLCLTKETQGKERRPYCLRRFLGSESKFAEPKARPAGAVLCTAAKLASDPNNRNLRCSLQAGARTNSPSAQTSARPDPPEAPLLGATTRVWGALADSGSDSKTGSCQPDATNLIAARARITWARGQKHSKHRPFQGSYRSKTGNNRSSSRIRSPNAVWQGRAAHQSETGFKHPLQEVNK